MKSFIKGTVDQDLVDGLKCISRQENRSLSNLSVLAALEYLKSKRGADVIHTSTGRFEGAFSREATYERR